MVGIYRIMGNGLDPLIGAHVAENTAVFIRFAADILKFDDWHAS
jgi:hypothetical protein